jgi:hypothetical protein
MPVEAVRDDLHRLPEAVQALTTPAEPAREVLSAVRTAMNLLTDAPAAPRLRDNPGKMALGR